MNQRAAVVACTTVEAPSECFVEVEAFLRGPAQREVVSTPSVVTRELTALGATLSRFTGEIAAEYSVQDRAAEA